MTKKSSLFGIIVDNLKNIANTSSIDIKSIPKIVVASSSFFGILLLSNYIIMTNTPLPPIDASFGFTIAIFMVVFFVIFTVFLIVFFLPIIWEVRDDSVIRKLFPIYISNSDDNKKKIIPYAVINFSFIIEVIFHYSAYKFGKLSSYMFSIENIIVFMLSLAFSSGLSCIINRKNYRKASFKEIFLFFFKVNAKSIVWMYLFTLTFILYDETYRNDNDLNKIGSMVYHFGDEKVPPDYIAFFIVLSVHLIQSVISLRFKNILFMCLLYLLMFLAIYPGSNNMTAYILKLIGAGGGVHAELYIKSIQEDGKNKIIAYKTCIMFSTSSSVVTKNIKGIEQSIDGYYRSCDKLSKNKAKDKIYEYQFVDTVIFNRSDIHSIKFPNKPNRGVLLSE
ncbi:hypothetical protein FBY14_11855 [Azospirillum brasilense]|nr:hypothetical protein FBY14_11855 [Azospirillum brasilense]